jgi:hypothetical protein
MLPHLSAYILNTFGVVLRYIKTRINRVSHRHLYTYLSEIDQRYYTQYKKHNPKEFHITPTKYKTEPQYMALKQPNQLAINNPTPHQHGLMTTPIK